MQINEEFIVKNKRTKISISNPNDFDIEFDLKINGKLPLTINDMLEEIEKIAATKSIPNYEAAFWFVTYLTSHYKLFSICTWKDHPEIFLNSVGRELCGDRAAVLQYLWMAQGYETRLHAIDLHVIPEVYNGKRWKMYDPDYCVYFLNSEGEVASVKELENNAKYFKNYKRIKREWDNRWIFFYTSFAKSDYLDASTSRIFETNIDHFYNKIHKVDFKFYLPSNSTLNIYRTKNHDLCRIELILNENSKGRAAIPFIPYKATGKFSLRTQSAEYFNQSTKDQIYFDRERQTKYIEIISVDSKTKITYLTNPNLNFIEDILTININSNHNICLGVDINSNISLFNNPCIINFTEAYDPDE